MGFTSTVEIKMDADDLVTQVNQYKMGKVLGQGTYGIVYQARGALRSASTGTPQGAQLEVAVKVLNRSVLKRKKVGKGTALDGVLKEIGVMKKLSHPHCVQLFEVLDDKDKDCMYLVMEFVAGGDLNRPIKCGEAVSEATLRGWMRDVVLGLEHLHSYNILHRDIKPENILLSVAAIDGAAGGSTPQQHARLGDVGLAKELDYSAGMTFGMTHVSSVHQLGTPGYIDPLVSNSGQYSEATDGYAMGMTLTVALVNKPQLADNLEVLDELLEDPTCAPRYADATAGWPEAVSLKLAGLIKGLMGARQRRNRMSHHAALADLEKLADEHELRPGIAAAPDVKECVVCMVNPRATRFGCGHALCCAHCADELVKRGDVCPTCRCTITIADRGGHIGVEQTFAA